jgi:hypothetical protein
MEIPLQIKQQIPARNFNSSKLKAHSEVV